MSIRKTEGAEEAAHILSRSGVVVIPHFGATLCSTFLSFFTLREAVALHEKGLLGSNRYNFRLRDGSS